MFLSILLLLLLLGLVCHHDHHQVKPSLLSRLLNGPLYSIVQEWCYVASPFIRFKDNRMVAWAFTTFHSANGRLCLVSLDDLIE